MSKRRDDPTSKYRPSAPTARRMMMGDGKDGRVTMVGRADSRPPLRRQDAEGAGAPQSAFDRSRPV